MLKIENGVSRTLAQYRKLTISHIQYDIRLSIPENKTETIGGKEILTFNYKKQDKNPIQIDFKEDPKTIKTITVNNQLIKSNIENEHIIIDVKYLKSGENTIKFSFNAGNAALNRRDDFLYTLFVPDRARTAFPCFDQPDLKAHFLLTLTIPKQWNAIANGKIKDSTVHNNRKTYRFALSDILPTYLFSFVAGNFKIHNSEISHHKTQLLYRENDSSKVTNSLDSIFQLYENSLQYYQKWTGIQYPFQKHGMVSIPDFQFGGMEHPGAILFQNAALFLDKNATQSQLNSRSNLIGHEVAHMWFGDMVTMDWFTDVWMKEVFANFMADKSTGVSSNKDVYDLKFLTSHFPAAYAVDRTLGTNPIRQPLDNLQNAGMLYGPIIYDKAPIMMRQLELLMGEENFRKGVNKYLKKYAYSNASWTDLISILDSETEEDLQSWNKVWVNQTGRPIIDYTVNYKNDKIDNFTLSQHPEYGTENKVWKHTFQLSLYYPDTTIITNINFLNETQDVPELRDKAKPLFILLNTSGIGYGVFGIDTTMLSHFSTIKKPIHRASAYISLYENMLNSNIISPVKLLDFFSDQLENETTELNLRLITNYISSIYWEYLNPKSRLLESRRLEDIVWNAMNKQAIKNNKKLLLDCYENIFQSDTAYNNLYAIWEQQTHPVNINLNEDDYTNLSLALALRSNDNESLLQQQLSRIKNNDRINRFKIIMQAVSSNTETRNQFFNGLSNKQNRSNESAIGTALTYLHHPLRQETSIAYLQKSLELLAEIQKTGDIFFPDNWLRSTFYNYQYSKAQEIVHTFLATHQDYNPTLKNKILQATDNLRRAQKLSQQN